MINLSENQVKILKTIKEKVDTQGYPPSVREICCITGIKSTSTVHWNMNKLEELGFIKKDPTKPRAIEILNYIEENKDRIDKEIIKLPVIEFLNNGLGFEENIIENIKLPYELVIGKDNFIFKSKDNKMIEVGVLKNDYIIIDRNNEVANGKIVLGVIENDGITLGRYFKDKDSVRLEFENCFCDPLIIEKNKFNIIGQVRGHFRIIK
ncbi:MAG: transcriptional repressor LexA [Paraclostridium sp.]